MSEEARKTRAVSLYDLTPAELESFFLSIGEKAYRAKQALDFLYRHPQSPEPSFDTFTTFPVALRRRLSETVELAPLTLHAAVKAPDGTVKHAYEVRGHKDALLESVWMRAESTDVERPEDTEQVRRSAQTADERIGRHTLCVSSQLGCAAGCVFCATGAMGLLGQLSAGEIVYQVVHCLILYEKLPDAILFMGMGEPMRNFEAVSAAVEILTHPDALGLSPRRIVVSTAGEMERLGAFHRRFPRVRLAISLNGATDDLRGRLMPVNDRFDLEAISAFISSIDIDRRERVTLEYVVLGGVNDTPVQIRALVRFLNPLARRVKVNLIPFNPVQGKSFRPPSRDNLLSFQAGLREIGVRTFIRRNRGSGADAACGQLAGRT